MFGSNKTRQNREFDVPAVALGWMDRFFLVAGDNGAIHVHALLPTLTAEEISLVLASLARPEILDGLTEITFELGCVESIPHNWTLLLAMLMNFARHVRRSESRPGRTGVRCRVVGLQAQPAAAAMLYRGNAELMNLLTGSRQAAA